MNSVAADTRGRVAGKRPGSSRWFRLNLWLHRWTSLIVTLPFLVLCVTRSILIFHSEIDQAIGVVPAAQNLGQDAAPPLSESVAHVLAAHPGQVPLLAATDPVEHPGVLMVYTAPVGQRDFAHAVTRFTSLATGQPLGSRDLTKTFTGVLLDLHAKWFLGPTGELIGAAVALLVLVSLLSGLVVYAPYVRKIAFGVLRRGRGSRLLHLDLHNFIGVVVLGWALVVTVTGLALGFGTVALTAWRTHDLAAIQARHSTGQRVDPAHPAVGVDHVWRAALDAAPANWHIISMVWPDTMFSAPSHYTVLVGGPDGLSSRLFRVALVNATSGKVDAVAELPWYLKGIVLSQPLHFGDYGGMALKVLWVLCAWLTLFITGNGAWLWWKRHRRRPHGEMKA
jgi:uncharacterized iron-regulated membrane protein